MDNNIYGVGYVDGTNRTSLYNLNTPSNIDGNIVKIVTNFTNYSYIFTDTKKLYRKAASSAGDTLEGYTQILPDINITDILNQEYILSGSVIYKIDGTVLVNNVEKVLGFGNAAGYTNFICYKTGDGVYHFWENGVELVNLANTGIEWDNAILLNASGGGSSRLRTVLLYNSTTLGYWNQTTKYTAPKTIKKVITRDISTASHQPLILFNDGTLAQGINFTDISTTFTEAPYYNIDQLSFGSTAGYTVLYSENNVTFYKNYGSYGNTQILDFPGKYAGSAAIYRGSTIAGNFTSSSSFLIVSNIITYDWTIKDPNDEILVTEGVKPALAAYLTIEDNVATLSVTDVLGGNVNINFNVYTPKGFGFVGLALNKEALTPDIPINESTLLYGLASNLDLYILYQKVLPTDAINVILYQNRGEKNRVNKRNYLTEVMKLRGVFRGPFSIEEPTLTLQLNEFINFNYVYIQELQRYYFVRSSTGLNNNFYDINLKVDPLFSFMNEFKTSTAEILRSSIISKQDPYIVDNLLPLKNDNIIDVYTIDNDIFNNDNDVWKDNFNYVLSCIRAVNLKAAHDFEEWQVGGG